MSKEKIKEIFKEIEKAIHETAQSDPIPVKIEDSKLIKRIKEIKKRYSN